MSVAIYSLSCTINIDDPLIPRHPEISFEICCELYSNAGPFALLPIFFLDKVEKQLDHLAKLELGYADYRYMNIAWFRGYI